MITSVTVGGAAVPLDDVLADATIRHGRSDPLAQAEASSAQLTLLGVTRALTGPFDVGAALVIGTPEGPRFTGYITDAQLDDDRLTVLGIGTLARHGRRPMPLNWTAPAESWSARVARVGTAAGLAAGVLVVETDPTYNPTIAARVAPDPLETEPALLGDELAALADVVGALLCDRPDGKLLMQALGSRTSAGTVALDPADVLYTPPWLQTDELSNEVTVTYSGGAVTLTDSASVGLFDRRRSQIETELASSSDASARAVERLARVAFPRWNMPSCPVLVFYPLALGRMVTVTELPDSAPFPVWHALVEGWTDQIVGPDWTINVSLSDPLISGLTLPWVDVPVTAAYHWNTINQTVQWRDALSIDALAP